MWSAASPRRGVLDAVRKVAAPSWEAVMGANQRFDVSSGRAARLASLRSAISAGTYTANPADVAESLVAWIATPVQFDRSVKFFDDDVDPESNQPKDHNTRR